MSMLLIAATAVFFLRPPLSAAPLEADEDTRRAVLFYVVANVAFYASMGFNAERLAWTIVPAFLVILGLHIGLIDDTLTGTQRLWFRVGVYTVAIAYPAYTVMRAGPFA